MCVTKLARGRKDQLEGSDLSLKRLNKRELTWESRKRKTTLVELKTIALHHCVFSSPKP